MRGTGLRYTGGSIGGSIAGIPARDLSPAEVEAHGGAAALLATGLYEMCETEKTESIEAGDEGPAGEDEWQELNR